MSDTTTGLGVAAKIVLSLTVLEVAVGGTLGVTATIEDVSGSVQSGTVSWVSREPGIATVDSNGNVTGVARGTVILEAFTPAFGNANVLAGKVYAEVNVTVSDASTSQQATPTFSPVAGNYGPTQNVTITSASADAIYYTTDGSTPTTSSTLYTAPVVVAVTTTLKAIAVKAGVANSAVGSAVYTINGAQATPTFSPVAGAYVGTQSVTITSAGADAIYYTTDGSTPTTGSTLYSGPVSVAASETVKALAVKAGWSNSAIGSAAYTIS